uniref:Transmembrane protein n=1 Tax=Heterorhabditis bacteriophora TaxID=37862 RepID=A0A1I7X6K2_HETBA
MTIVAEHSIGRVWQEEGERIGDATSSRRGTDPALLSRFLTIDSSLSALMCILVSFLFMTSKFPAIKYLIQVLLISFLLETGVIHYSLSTHAEQTTFECLQCFKCTRPIQSGLLWRDGGVLHVAYYDGFVRVGIIMEDYDDMLLVQRLTTSKNNLNALLNVIYTEIRRLTNYENTEHERRCNMLEIMKSLQEKIPTTAHAENGNKEDDELCAVYEKFSELKITFKNHSIRADRVSQRLIALKKLLALALKAFEANSTLEKTIAALELTTKPHT